MRGGSASLCLGVLAVVVQFSFLPPASAQSSTRSASKGSFQASYFGEDGGKEYKPSPEESDFLHNYGPHGPHRDRPPESADSVGGAGRREARTLRDAVPSRPSPRRRWIGPRHFREKAAAEPANLETGEESQRDLQRYSLWTGLNAPLVLPARRMAHVSPDQASAQGRADYGKKILGEAGEGAQPARTLPSENEGRMLLGKLGRPAAADAEKSKGLFIGLELDLASEGVEYRDALANLARSVGFVPDNRFPAEFRDYPVGALGASAAPGGRYAPGTAGKEVQPLPAAKVWGWLPARNLQSLVRLPQVARVDMEPGSGRSNAASNGAASSMVLALRIPSGAGPSETLRAALDRWDRDAGFVLERTIGLQRIPNSTEHALIVAGRLPVRRLSVLMADPGVVKMMPFVAPPSDDKSALSASARSAARRRLDFASMTSGNYAAEILIACLFWVGWITVVSRRY
ncbi:MAG: hypothetical protein HY551_07730 [Elusimicrobia bacterium]|nr:hypothetical protein [Elusimicrobiota bacterium]